MEFFGRATKTDDVNDAWHLLELALQDPVLRHLQVHQAVALADQLVAIDFTDCRSRGELRLHTGRELNHLQTIEDFLSGKVVIRLVLEITLDVRKAKERDRADVVEARHAIELRLDWYGDLALHLFRGPSRVLRNDLNSGGRRVGVGLNVEQFESVEATNEEQDC